jgi:hypothetical protein
MPRPSNNTPTKEKVGYNTIESAAKAQIKSSNPISTVRKK